MDKINSILIIEDDRFIGEMYVRSLKNAGYQVDWMVTGPDGLKAATDKVYDLILLDIMLPGAQGSDILSSLRGKEGDKVPNSRIIVLTNFDQDDETREAMLKKVDAYLIKADITPRKLIDIIGTLKPARSA
ncbi:MAG TPA: response regulator [Candidatus Saccharimonadales bacterium]|nr:response regulator [Candidatus Saccharimonadales bacterium]